MKELLKSLKEIGRELLLIAYILIVFLAFAVPLWTQWGGKFTDTQTAEMEVTQLKSNIAYDTIELEGYYVWEK